MTRTPVIGGPDAGAGGGGESYFVGMVASLLAAASAFTLAWWLFRQREPAVPSLPASSAGLPARFRRAASPIDPRRRRAA